MCIIGLIDDSESECETYSNRLSHREIELLIMNSIENEEDIIDWVQDNRIEVLLIDYKLFDLYAYSGSNLIQRINNIIPDLPCFLFTSNPDEDVLVAQSLIIDKECFVEDTDGYANKLKQAAEVFRNRQEISRNEYLELLNKKKESRIEPKEEIRFFELQKRLVAYGVIEEVPEALQKSNFEERIDSLIKLADKIISENEER